MAPFLVKKVCILEVDVKLNSYLSLSSSKFAVDCSYSLSRKRLKKGHYVIFFSNHNHHQDY